MTDIIRDSVRLDAIWHRLTVDEMRLLLELIERHKYSARITVQYSDGWWWIRSDTEELETILKGLL